MQPSVCQQRTDTNLKFVQVRYLVDLTPYKQNTASSSDHDTISDGYRASM